MSVPKTDIDHKTCGHVNHVTLDASKHEEIHSAVFELVQEWLHAANGADYEYRLLHTAEAKALQMLAATLYRQVADDLVKALHPFEVEQ